MTTGSGEDGKHGLKLEAISSMLQLRENEAVLGCWLVERRLSAAGMAGFLIATSDRVAFAATSGQLTQFPVEKISFIEKRGPSELVIMTWSLELSVKLRQQQSAGAVITALRRHPGWSAVEFAKDSP